MENNKDNNFDEVIFSDEDTIYEYTSIQAIEDGILMDLTPVMKKIYKSNDNYLLNYSTINFIEEGYCDEEYNINIPNLIDLINQIHKHIRDFIKENDGQEDHFYSLDIETPKGEIMKIFVVQNETGHYTVMKPEDY